MADHNRVDAAVVLGSDTDFPTVEGAAAVLKKFDVAHEVRVLSAHRSPDALREYVGEAEARGVRVFIAAAGGAAHLPGVIASHTIRPVLGIPVPTMNFLGIDSLLSILQMPGGVPVAAMPLGKAGGRNAGLFAVEILATSDPALAQKLKSFREEQVKEVAERDQILRKKLTGQ